jgi:hypothetical protein
MLSILFGCLLLGAAAAIFWVAKGPLQTEERTTGGVLYTQPELSVSGDLGQMEVVTDNGSSSASIVGEPEVSSDVTNDILSVDAQEAGDAPQTSPAMAPQQMTNDIVLDESTGVEVAPLALEANTAPIDTASGQGGPSMMGSYEQRVVELEWPAHFRVGQADTIRIKFKMLDGGSVQPVAEIGSHEVLGTPILITDRYDLYDATVTAAISAPDFNVTYLTNSTQSLERGGEPEWRWSLKSNKAQSSVIVLTLSITWTPKSGGTPLQTTIWGQSVQAEVDYVIGTITVPQASYIGTGLAVLSIVAQIPLLSKVLDILWDSFFAGRKRRRSRQQSNRRRR